VHRGPTLHGGPSFTGAVIKEKASKRLGARAIKIVLPVIGAIKSETLYSQTGLFAPVRWNAVQCEISKLILAQVHKRPCCTQISKKVTIICTVKFDNN